MTSRIYGMHEVHGRPLENLSGRKKVEAANRIMHAENRANKQSKLASRNAYRRAIGLPEVE